MIAKVVLIFLLLILFVQDVKDREVSVWLLFLLFILSGYYFSQSVLTWIEPTLNLCFLIVLFSITYVVMTLVFRKKYDEMIGGGDLIFLLAITPLFRFEEFIYWVVVSLTVSLFIHLINQQILKPKNQTIPLISYLSVCLTLFLILKLF